MVSFKLLIDNKMCRAIYKIILPLFSFVIKRRQQRSRRETTSVNCFTKTVVATAIPEFSEEEEYWFDEDYLSRMRADGRLASLSASDSSMCYYSKTIPGYDDDDNDDMDWTSSNWSSLDRYGGNVSPLENEYVCSNVYCDMSRNSTSPPPLVYENIDVSKYKIKF